MRFWNCHTLSQDSERDTLFGYNQSQLFQELISGHRQPQNSPVLTEITSTNPEPYLHLLPLSIEAVLQLLELPLQVLHSLAVPQALHLRHLEPRLCNLLLPTDKPAGREEFNTTSHQENVLM